MHIIFCCNLRNIPPEKVTPSSESFPSRHLAYPFRPHLFENPIQYPAPYKKGDYPLSLEVRNLKLYWGPEERKPSKCIEKWLLVEEPQDFLARKL